MAIARAAAWRPGGRRTAKRRAIFFGLAAAAWLSLAAQAQASVPALGDCLEASDFIANAALARDDGMTRAAFMDRLVADFAAIRAFPAELRWFVKDPDDERFLAAAVRHVFDEPAAPAVHRADFLRACLGRLVA